MLLRLSCVPAPTLTKNYGHAIVESMIAECPVIISKETTPWSNLGGRAGYVVELHNVPELAEAVNKIVALDDMEYKALQS